MNDRSVGWFANPTKTITPAKPIANPTIRLRVNFSFNQKKAIIVPKRGAVAFKIPLNPADKYKEAKANSKKGIAEFIQPTTNKGINLLRI